MKIVRPKKASGMNLSWNLNIFSGPKWYIECGQCGIGFQSRIPLADNPVIACPHCGTGNRLPIVYE